MEFQASVSTVLSQKTDCIVVPVFNGGKFGKAAQAVDKESRGALKKLVKSGDLKDGAGEVALLPQLSGCAAERVLVVGMGDRDKVGATEFRKGVQAAAGALKKTASKNAVLYLADVSVKERDEAWKARQAALIFALSFYQFDSLKSKKKPAPNLKKVTYGVNERKLATSLKQPMLEAAAMGVGTGYCRDLGNLPANICTPTYLAKEARKLADPKKKISVKVLSEKQMSDLGMGSLLSVAAGSKEPAKLIVVEYKGGKKSDAPTVLVGKGITFDTGGISLKPGQGMDEMKFDMCGAASVMGTMKAVAQLQPKANIIGIVAAAENMPSGRATKPGDVVTSMSGRTIEILNTDAEGRLVLCDALTYAERYKPKAVVDIATLTGACIVALGDKAAGLYSNRDDLADKLLSAGEQSHDRAWRMPLWPEYRKQLESNFADLANIGGPKAGSVTAAVFLSYFAENYPWAHLDIAGVAWLSGSDKGATGRPVPLLMSYLIDHG